MAATHHRPVNRGGRIGGLAWRSAIAASLIPGIFLAAPSSGALLFFAPYAVVGAVLVTRRPRNAVGWLLLAAGWVYVFADRSIPSAGPLIAGTASWQDQLLAWLGGWAAQAVFTLFFAVTILFPEGRLPVGRRGIAVRLALGASAAMVVLVAVLPRISVNAKDAPDGIFAPNPYALLHGDFWDQVTPEALLFVALAMLVVGVVLMGVRLFRARDLERQQLRWVMTSLALITLTIVSAVVLGSLFAGVGDLAWYPVVLALPLLPVAVGVAVLRYRLYELDLIISRSISYLLLTALLAGTYAAAVSLVQKVFVQITGDRSDAAIVISTLLLASVFTPIRKWLEAAVDRRFKPVHDIPAAAVAEASDGLTSVSLHELADWETRMELIAQRVFDERQGAAVTRGAESMGDG